MLILQIFEYLSWARYGPVLGAVDRRVNRPDPLPVWDLVSQGLKSTGTVMSSLPEEVQAAVEAIRE